MIQLRISVLPSLFLVWLSKIGYFSLTAMAPAMPSRTSCSGVVLLVELVHSLQDSFPEGAQVRAPVGRVLAVDEGEVGLAVVFGVGECELDAARPDSRRCRRDTRRPISAFSRSNSPFSRSEILAVEDKRQPAVQVCVVPDPLFDELAVEGELAEDLRIRDELDDRCRPSLSCKRLLFRVSSSPARKPPRSAFPALGDDHGSARKAR